MADLALLLLPRHSAKSLKAQEELLANSPQLATAVPQNGDRFRGGLEELNIRLNCRQVKPK